KGRTSVSGNCSSASMLGDRRRPKKAPATNVRRTFVVTIRQLTARPASTLPPSQKASDGALPERKGRAASRVPYSVGGAERQAAPVLRRDLGRKKLPANSCRIRIVASIHR